MKDPKASNSRKPWYQRLVEMATLWKRSISKSIVINPSINVTLWKSISKSTTNQSQQNNIRKFTSLNLVTRVCLCAPISSFNEIFQAEFPPRTSYSHARPNPSFLSPSSTTTQGRVSNPRLSVDRRRRIFRGKSLTDDVSMRKFVVEEEAMMQVRRRNQMEVIKKRSLMRRREKLGPSPLSNMVMAQDDLS